MTNPVPEDRRSLEFAVLRLLCSSHMAPGTRESLMSRMDLALFQDEINRIVYEEVRRLGHVSFIRLSELLPTLVTKRGIPDFDFKSLLNGDASGREEFTEGVNALRTLFRESGIETDPLVKKFLYS